MIAGLALGADNKRYFRGQLPRLAIITILLMPLLYGAMYLWAFWDPFAKVNRVPAAIVNLDRGATLDGKQLRAGDQVTRALLSSGEIDLHQLSLAQAKAQLADGRVYFTITLPADFSAAIASASGKDPRPAPLRFTFNDANSYLATVIGRDAAQQVINQVTAAVGAQTVDQVLVSIEDSGTQLSQAVAGASQLADGLTKAKAATAQLDAGSVQLDSGLGSAKRGSAQLAAGTSELQAKVDAVSNPALKLLSLNYLQQLGAQASALSAQATAIKLTLPQFGQSALAAWIEVAIGDLKASSLPAVAAVGNKLAAAAADFRARLDATRTALANFSNQLSVLATQLRSDTTTTLGRQLTQINSALSADIKQLQSGVAKLNGGAQQLDSGLVALKGGSARLAAGTAELHAGTAKLRSGAATLHNGLKGGLAKVPSWTPAQRRRTAAVLASPTQLVTHTENEAATFGVGFAPFFCSLSLFVGGILIWMLLTPLQPRPVSAGVGSYRTAFISFVPALLAGAIQATILFLVVTIAVGLDPAHGWGMWLFLILMSGCFLTLIQAFNAIFDLAIGRVLTLAFLMFALIASGGIYPVPTTAGLFQVLHPYDPMTYTVNGLRQLTVSHAVDSRLWVAIAVLAGLAVVSLSATALAVWRNRIYTMERLHPSIEV